MRWLARLLLGKGTFKPEMRTALEAEGLVLIEEGLGGSVRYTRFRAPRRYHHGKVTPERMALALTGKRLAVYCRSGRVKLIDSEFTSPNWDWVDLTARDGERLVFRVDYDRAQQPKLSGVVEIHVKTTAAQRIADELSRRLGR